MHLWTYVGTPERLSAVAYSGSDEIVELMGRSSDAGPYPADPRSASYVGS